MFVNAPVICWFPPTFSYFRTRSRVIAHNEKIKSKGDGEMIE